MQEGHAMRRFHLENGHVAGCRRWSCQLDASPTKRRAPSASFDLPIWAFLSSACGVAGGHRDVGRAFVDIEKMISKTPAVVIDPFRGNVDNPLLKVLPGGAGVPQ